MTIFDLVFIAVFFATVVTLAMAAFAAVRGRRARALATLRGFGVFAVVYLGIVILVSLTTPRRVLNVGDDQCSDDWCIAVADVKRTPANAVVSYAVTLRVSSRARRVAQSEGGVSVYLIDDRGRRYDPVPDAAAVALSVMLQPRESVSTTRVFELPTDAHDAGLVVGRGAFPGCIIIGDDQSLFHKRTIVRLD